MDLTMIALGFFSFLKLVTIMAFVLCIVFFVPRNGIRRSKRWQRAEQWQGSAPSGEDQAILDDINRVAERMERRLETLEKILEADDPRWKERAR